MTTSMTSSPRPFGLFSKLVYGFGSLAVGTKQVAFSAYLLIFYNQVVGIPAHLVSLAILGSLIVDAISDPIVGEVSDNFRSRWGRRHPFMYFAALPTAVLFLLLWAPPAGWSDLALVAYMFIVGTASRVFITFYEIPASALTHEFTTDYDQRTSLMSFRYFFGYVGGLGTSVLALKVFLTPTDRYPVGQLNPDGYLQYGMAGAAIIFVAILVSTAGTHSRIKGLPQAVPHVRRSVLKTVSEMASTVRHKAFLQILSFGVLKYTAMGLTSAMAIYFGLYVWGLGANGLALLALDGILSVTIALFVAPLISKRFGKKNAAIAMAIGGVMLGLVPYVLRLSGVFFENGHPALLPVLFAFQVVTGIGTATSAILVSSMIADVVDDSARRTGRHSAGLFFAASSFMQKCTGGLGVMAAGLVLTLAAFPEGARPGQVSQEVLDRLLFAYVPVIALFWGVAAIILSFYRIDRLRHEENVRGFQAGAAGTDQLGSEDPQGDPASPPPIVSPASR